MKILVTAKRVPDPEQKVKLKGGAVDLTGMNFVVNPFDEYAIEAALQLRDKLADGSTVTILSMVADTGKEVVRKARRASAQKGG